MGIYLVTGRQARNHITSDDVGTFNAATIGAGIYLLPAADGSYPHITLSDSNHVSVPASNYLVQGRFVRISTPHTLTIESGRVGAVRNDIVCLKYTRDSGQVENMDLEIKKTTSTTTPHTPAEVAFHGGSILNMDSTVYLPLAAVRLDGVNVRTPVMLAQDLALFSTTHSTFANKIDTKVTSLVTDTQDQISTATTGMRSQIDELTEQVNSRVANIQQLADGARSYVDEKIRDLKNQIDNANSRLDGTSRITDDAHSYTDEKIRDLKNTVDNMSSRLDGFNRIGSEANSYTDRKIRELRNSLPAAPVSSQLYWKPPYTRESYPLRRRGDIVTINGFGQFQDSGQHDHGDMDEHIPDGYRPASNGIIQCSMMDVTFDVSSQGVVSMSGNTRGGWSGLSGCWVTNDPAPSSSSTSSSSSYGGDDDSDYGSTNW